MRGVAVGVVLALLGVYFIDNYLHARHPPGILAPSDPWQGPTGSGIPWSENGNQFTPLADFHLRARVLHTESYWLDHGSAISAGFGGGLGTYVGSGGARSDVHFAGRALVYVAP